jgi:hypothetical protein
MEKLTYIKTSEAIEGYADSLIAKNEYNDCVVRAFASSIEMPYEKAHAFVTKTFKRKPKKGVPTFPLINWLKENYQIIGDKRTTFSKYESPCTYYKERRFQMSVGKFAKLHPVGNYFLLVSGHAFTIKDGCVIGNVADAMKPRTIVQFAFKIK